MIFFIKNNERKHRVKGTRSEKNMRGDKREDITMLRIFVKKYFQLRTVSEIESLR